MSDPARPLRTAVVIGSTRENRVGETIGQWFTELTGSREDNDVELIDLAAFRFPERHPEQPTDEVNRFTSRIDAAEAFVLVTPEYNRGYPAALKQGIDYAFDEWQGKPVGFVSYGYRWEGRYAVEQLRDVFTELHTVTLGTVVGFDLCDGQAEPAQLADREPAAHHLLDQLTWWGLTLREGRAARPFVS